MFENVIESQQNTGLRGLLNRHFGTIDTPEHAFKTVRTIAKAFFWLAAITGVIGFFLVGIPALFDAIIYAGLGFWLLRRQSSRLSPDFFSSHQPFSHINEPVVYVLWR